MFEVVHFVSGEDGIGLVLPKTAWYYFRDKAILDKDNEIKEIGFLHFSAYNDCSKMRGSL